MNFDIVYEKLISKFKPSVGKTIAILPGGFKPPHTGHFNALNYILDEADSGIVYIGKGIRDGITPDQSKKIWDIYKKHLRKPVDIFIAETTPVASTYEFVENNPKVNIVVGAGPEDEKRFDYFKKNIEKFPLVKIINIPAMNGRISGTAVRSNICKKTPNAVDCFIPKDGDRDLLTAEEKQQIKNILKI